MIATGYAAFVDGWRMWFSVLALRHLRAILVG